ncbi:trigger factor [Candidatus Gracilibacteria bacterium]|nr:trigger factor [Candidatus Gracilibacteria bacterium]
MKVTTEKLPKSLLAVEIELDKAQLEKGLDRAARRLSQKVNVPGFRKGKAPRFIIENYFGRDALMEEASEDLINNSFKAALEQEGIDPIGPASLDHVISSDPFTFRVNVPVAPTITLPAYRAIRVERAIEPVTDEMLSRSLDALRDKHVVLKELDEPRPAQQGDQLTVRLESIVDGEPLEERQEGEEVAENPLVLEPGRVVDELYQGLLGANVGDKLEIAATMPEDHQSEQVRGKQVTFKVDVTGMQERMLPEWEDLPSLEAFEGSIDELREKTFKELEDAARQVAERDTLDSYLEQLVAQTEYDLPDVLIENQASDMLHEQSAQFERYGITLEQMLQYRGKTPDEAVAELLPDAERQLKTTLALQNLVRSESLVISEDEIDNEVARMVLDYAEDERGNVGQMLASQYRGSVASVVLDRKLRERLLAIARGAAPELATSDENTAAAEPTASDERADSSTDAATAVASEMSAEVSEQKAEVSEQK